MKKNIALIGIGYWGNNHLRNLAGLGVLHSVFDTNAQLLYEKSKDHPNVHFVQDENKILNNSDIEAVVIAAPAEFHYALTRKYLLAGRDVFVEKPLSLRVSDGEDLIDIASKKNRILMVGHILQYHPAIKKLKEIVESGDIGEIRYIYSNRLNLGRVRIEENVLWSFAPHDISVILMLMNGAKPIHVSAFGGCYITKTVYDTTVTELVFKNNIRSHIYVSWLHPFKEQKLVVIGSKKMAVFDDQATNKLILYPYAVHFQEGSIPVVQQVKYNVVHVEQKEPLREELLHFIDCTDSRKKPKTDGEEGLSVLEVLHLAQRSLREGKMDKRNEAVLKKGS